MEDTHSISMASCRYSWEVIDNEAKKLNMKRSEFLQSLVEHYFTKKRKINIKLTEILMLLMLAMIALLLVVLPR